MKKIRRCRAKISNQNKQNRTIGLPKEKSVFIRQSYQKINLLLRPVVFLPNHETKHPINIVLTCRLILSEMNDHKKIEAALISVFYKKLAWRISANLSLFMNSKKTLISLLR
jgi:hypothetical protein